MGFLAIMFSSSSCDKDKDGKGSLSLTFKGKVGDETMLLYSGKYPMTGTDSITMQVLEFLIADMRLVNTKGDTVSIKDIAEVDFAQHHTDIATAADGETVTINDIPIGEYTQLLLGIGVTPALNATDPGDHPTTSPLGDVGNYWAAWDSYIFSRVEGRFFLGGTTNQVSFLYHSGVDGMYQERAFTKAIEIEKNATTALTFDVNVKEIFIPVGDTAISIANNPASHSGAVGTAGYELAKSVVRNLANALHLQ